MPKVIKSYGIRRINQLLKVSKQLSKKPFRDYLYRLVAKNLQFFMIGFKYIMGISKNRPPIILARLFPPLCVNFS